MSIIVGRSSEGIHSRSLERLKQHLPPNLAKLWLTSLHRLHVFPSHRAIVRDLRQRLGRWQDLRGGVSEGRKEESCRR